MNVLVLELQCQYKRILCCPALVGNNHYNCNFNSIFAELLFSMSAELQKIQEVLSPVKEEIVQHQVYKVINSTEDLRIFMRFHVYAVWDFMSLLKALQINLTCTTLPWFPVGSGSTRALINEIVAGEESDADALGNKKSHFEMYLDAMEQCGAETAEIRNFITALQSGQTLDRPTRLQEPQKRPKRL